MFPPNFLRLQPLSKCSSLVILPLACYLAINSRAIASAQIVPDATLPNNSQVITNSNLLEIIGGTAAGDNLFHSFEAFSVLSGQTAFFNNAVNIENIIGRVTGSSLSNIDGLIKANGSANLFLINPNGIIFGENAALNIGGSFISSTADSIQFADGTQFSAVNPNAEPLLTVSIPVGLQYGTNPGDITVRGSGNNLSIDFDTFTIDRSTRPTGLEVSSGKTLALIGGNVTLEGGNITAPEGRIELGSVGAGETVQLTPIDTGWQLNYTDVATFGELALSDAASVDVSGNGSGNVQLHANRISFTNGSAIVANTLGDGTGGEVTVIASDTLEVVGVSDDNFFPSGIKAHVDIDATGSGSNIIIDTKDLSITDGAQIEAITFGFGDGGNLDVSAQDIKVIGGNEFVPSGLFAYVELFAEGNGGSLTISTDTLKLQNGAQIYTRTFGLGNAGNLNIEATEIEVIGFDPGGPSSLASSSESLAPDLIAEGNGGNLNLFTDTLQVADGGQIQTLSSGLGNAGVLNIQAREIELSGTTPFGSSGLLSNAFFLSGNGGNINVTTNELDIKNGAIISASNFQSAGRIPPGEGQAGNVTINANTINLDNTNIETPSRITASTFQAGGGNIELNANNITIQNNSEITAETQGDGSGGAISFTANSLELSNGALVSSNTTGAGNAGQILLQINDNLLVTGNDTGIFSQATADSTGDSGQIDLNAGFLTIADNAQIDTSTFGAGDGGAVTVTTDALQLIGNGTISSSSTASGQAGDINVTASNLLTNEGQIIATSEETGGGEISITSDSMYLNNNSVISTSVNDSNGGGGNINIDSNTIVTNRNSDIRANAIFGSGGNINISTEVIFTSSNSDVDASSQFGLDGVVEITNPDTNQQIGIIELPDTIQDPTQLITATCPIQKNNVMVVSGKGGLPDNPGSHLRGQSVWQDTRLIIPELTAINSQDSSTEITSKKKSIRAANTVITEAKGWMVNADGNVELLTYNSNQSPINSWYRPFSCQDVSNS